ncbi:TPA: serine hydroxymethyltransferase, partial [Candidatus Bathyarchaeota archaeon]|nr:serine hydroxymethyltransferase [Candidatus Bathyarchaeota archaeon]
MYRELVQEVLEQLRKHHEYRSRSLNLIASENITSPQVRLALGSDLGHRYAIGFLYTRIYRGC